MSNLTEQESRDQWAALLRETRRRRDAADAAAITGETHAMRQPGCNTFVIVSPSVTATDYPSGWRVTRFDECGEAIGHFEARDAQAAYREMFAGGYEIVPEESLVMD